MRERSTPARSTAWRPPCEADRLGSKATPATKALERAKVPVKTHAYEHDPRHESYGLEAAEALGLDPATVFKTLVADVDGKFTVAIVPVELQLDLKALAQAVDGKKAQLADVKQAQRTTGYVAGGIRVTFQGKTNVTAVQTLGKADTTINGIGVGSGESSVKSRIKGVTCEGVGSARSCHTGSFTPGKIVTDFRIASGKVTSVTVGVVVD